MIKVQTLLKRIEAFDESSMRTIVKWRRTPITFALKAITYSGTGKAWFLISTPLILLDRKGIIFIGQQEIFLRSMLAAFIAWATGAIIKRIIARKRPSQKITNYAAQVQLPSDSSFPSSHASSSVAFFCALASAHHPIAPVVGVWALLVSFSRFYLGVHFPSDLLGGVILGLICGQAVTLLTHY